jgi:ABC-type multidrug transport system fused ATPase/permease subunit
MKEIIKLNLEKLNFYIHYVGIGLFFLVFFSFLTGFLESIGISLIFPIFQTLLSDQNLPQFNIPIIGKIIEFLGFENSLSNLVILLSISFSLKASLKFLTGYLKVNYSTQFLLDLRKDLVQAFTEQNYSNYIKTDAGRLSNIITAEVVNLVSGFIYFSNYLVSIFTGLSFIIIILFINYWFAIVVLIFGSIYYASFRGINRSIKDFSKNITESNSKYNSVLIQYLQSYKYLKATNSYKKIQSQLLKLVKENRYLRVRKDMRTNLVSSIQEPALILMITLIVYISLKVFHIEGASVLLLLMLFYRSTNYFLTSQNIWNTFLSQSGSTSSVKNLLNELRLNKETNSGIELIKDLKGSIQLNNINFSYKPGNKVLSDVSVEIAANRTIAFVGRSGSGKSTLVNLVCGLLKIESGSINIDGIDIGKINLGKWRSKIGYITQESVIFNDNILNNITLWNYNEEKDEQKLMNAIKMSHLDSMIKSKIDLQNWVGDRGVSLSGGQKQRIAIARELYKEPLIMILDEATSALDSETEKYIQESIDALKGKITVLIIAHRFSTIRNADYIYVMDHGKIIEEGTYDNLINDGKYFKELSNLQS